MVNFQNLFQIACHDLLRHKGVISLDLELRAHFLVALDILDQILLHINLIFVKLNLNAPGVNIVFAQIVLHLFLRLICKILLALNIILLHLAFSGKEVNFAGLEIPGYVEGTDGGILEGRAN